MQSPGPTRLLPHQPPCRHLPPSPLNPATAVGRMHVTSLEWKGYVKPGWSHSGTWWMWAYLAGKQYFYLICRAEQTAAMEIKSEMRWFRGEALTRPDKRGNSNNIWMFKEPINFTAQFMMCVTKEGEITAGRLTAVQSILTVVKNIARATKTHQFRMRCIRTATTYIY